MLVAAIDIGSNSVKLAVGDVDGQGHVRITQTDRVTLQIGRQVELDGALGSDVIGSVAQAVGDFATRARLAGARRIDVVGTSAAREATDGKALEDAVSAAAGVPMRRLSGEEEAHLVSRSIEASSGMPIHDAVMLDIGGGSTEIVRSQGGLVQRRVSMPIGAVRLTDRLALRGADALTAAQIDALDAAISEALDTIEPHAPVDRAFGCGGIVTLAGRMVHFGMPPVGTGINGADRLLLERDDVTALREQLQHSTVEARMAAAGTTQARAEILPAGIALLDACMRHLQVEMLQVHEHGIRTGLLADIALR